MIQNLTPVGPTPPPGPQLPDGATEGPQEHVYYEEAYSYTDDAGVQRIGTRREADIGRVAARSFAIAKTARVGAIVLTASVDALSATAKVSAEVRTGVVSAKVTTDDDE
jgi:thiamine pyrophosphate-dependent acetolactate synthase large subunit-like protein